MKIQCVLCKEIVPIGTFQSTPAGISVTCRACEGDFFVESGTDEAETVAVADEDFDMRCPKCGEGQPENESCRVCGLRASLFDGYASDDDAEAVAELEPIWKGLADRWDDDKAHDEFLEAVATATQFAWGARCYRGRLREHPGEKRSQAQLKKITRMAEATMAVANPTGEGARKPYKNVALLLILLVLFAGLGGLYFLFKVQSRAKKPKANPDFRYTNPPMRPPPPTR